VKEEVAPSAPRPVDARATHFRLFDGFRAVAAAMIVVLHCSSQVGADGWKGTGALFARLDISVPIFFAISGFLLYRPFVVDHLSGRSLLNFRAFYWRRFLRIAPAYWLLITGAWLAFGSIHIHNLKDAVITYGLIWPYKGIWVAKFDGIFTVWSLAVEVAFYLALPFYALVFGSLVARSARKVALELAGCTVLVVGGFAIYAWLVWTRPNGSPSTQWLPAQIEFFALGMLLAVLSAADTPTTRAIGSRLGASPALAWGVAAACLAMTAWGIGLPHGSFFAVIHPGQHFAQEVLYGIAAVAFIVPGIWGPQDAGPIRRFLSNRGVQWFGLISYAVFLWHDQWAGQLAHGWNVYSHLPWPRFAIFVGLVFAFAIATAAISWHFIERPILALKSSGPGRRRVPRA
jgi:peptidoglycan/LPS O-acetylase OafA/YrhL